MEGKMRLPTPSRKEWTNAVSKASRRIPTITISEQDPEWVNKELQGKSKVLKSRIHPQQPKSKDRSSRNDTESRCIQPAKEVNKL